MLIAPENGAAFYATIAMADEPIEDGDPLNKHTLLKDSTASLYGFGATALPDDILKEIWRRMNHILQSGTGSLRMEVVDADKKPVPDVTLTFTSETGTVFKYMSNAYGLIQETMPVGTYTVTTDESVFHSFDPVTIKIQDKSFVDAVFDINIYDVGIMRVTESGPIQLPSYIKKVDLCAVGGGGGGAYTYSASGNDFARGAAGGGGGGVVATLLNYDVVGKNLGVVIGAGGLSFVRESGENISFKTYSEDGGQTSVVLNPNDRYPETVLAAAGGTGGTGTYLGTPDEGSGGRGGSNGGTAMVNPYRPDEDDGSDAPANEIKILTNGGEDGTPGTGTTTRAFGEADGELFASGGGAMAYNSTSKGGQGAGDGNKNTSTSDATQYGCGGGGCVSSSDNARGGNGMQGIVLIRHRRSVA